MRARLAVPDTDDPVAAAGLESTAAYVRYVSPQSPAARGGLVPGDRVLAVAGQPFHYWWVLYDVVDRADGKPLPMTVRRGGRTLDLTVTPEKVRIDDRYGQRIEDWNVGVDGMRQMLPSETVRRALSVPAALARGFTRTWEVISLTVVGIGNILKGSIPSTAVGGPVMIFDIAGKAAEQGFEPYVQLMAAISVSLGLLNLLPVPVLDGGHLLLFAIEGVRRRPLSRKAREVAQLVGLSLVLSLMVFAFWNDVSRYWSTITGYFR